MPKLPSLFLSDEEMGKKDDDHRTEKNAGAGLAAWAPARIPPTQPRRLLKRLFILVIVAIAVYEFIDNIPTDVPIRDRRHPQYGPQHRFRPPPATSPDVDVPNLIPDSVKHQPPKDAGVAPGVLSGKAPAGPAEEPSHAAHDHNGPFRFMHLAGTLEAIGETRGAYPLNKNVLFAASNLKSVATLLPIACQMGSELRSYVHFALASRSEIPASELQKINGVDESCHIIFHDARPTFASRSTEKRLRESVTKAFFHIYNYMHPQVIIIDNSANEEPSFLKGLRKQAAATPMPIIELPAHGTEKLSWMTKLDSQSLKVWNDVNIDILIQAAPGGGSLMRLLKSLGAADYFSSSPPHITLELPHDIDASTHMFLQDFQWPPAHSKDGGHSRPLSIRHRIPRKGLNEEESSIRFLESFWPAKSSNSHILILSPNVELSPNFFHYLKYSVLAYRYSIAAQVQDWNAHLLGISLELPSLHIDGSRQFKLPQKSGSTSSSSSLLDTQTPFLWEAPTSNALLVLGDKWVELHGFVSKILDVQHGATKTPLLLTEKLVSKRYPVWLEHMLRLCRARGYLTLYPSELASSQLITVHTETYVPPEEYANDLPKGTGRHDADSSDGVLSHSRGPLRDTLADGGVLPQLFDLPMVSWDGASTETAGLEGRALKYANDFRREVGGCVNDRHGAQKDGMAADLFCRV